MFINLCGFDERWWTEAHGSAARYKCDSASTKVAEVVLIVGPQVMTSGCGDSRGGWCAWPSGGVEWLSAVAVW